MNIDFCRIHGDYYAAVEVQNDYTGNYKVSFRKVPELNGNNERNIRVDGITYNIKNDFDKYLFNKTVKEDQMKEFQQWKKEYRQ